MCVEFISGRVGGGFSLGFLSAVIASRTARLMTCGKLLWMCQEVWMDGDFILTGCTERLFGKQHHHFLTDLETRPSQYCLMTHYP